MYNIRRWATERKIAAVIQQNRHSCEMHKKLERRTATNTHKGGHTFMGIITEESHTAISGCNMQQVSTLDDTGNVMLNVEIHIKIK